MENSRKMRRLRLLLPIFFFFFHQFLAFAEKRPYIVHAGGHSDAVPELSILTDEEIRDSHVELLRSFFRDEQKARDALLYSYTRAINGFAAQLADDEALAFSRHPGVAHISPCRAYKLQTTHSWEFLGLERDGAVPPDSLWTKARYGEDVIIANIDTGVWPESESFKDDGMGPIPSRWKGMCESHSEQKFPCNRKLIGARYFSKAFEAAYGQLNTSCNSPRDFEGHGTHTLSTAAGRFVAVDNLFFGPPNGTAKGGSPLARIAAYKVCWLQVNVSDCVDADVLAAMDAAIKDGVDAISISLAADPPFLNKLDDAVSIGSFRALKHGVSVIASAGNGGPDLGSVINEAPWLFTVGASAMDRFWESSVFFSNRSLKGQSWSAESLPEGERYPLINSIEAKSANSSRSHAELCIKGSLEPSIVKGKIVLCLRGLNRILEKSEVVKMDGGVGMVLRNNVTMGDKLIFSPHPLPATMISYLDGLELLAYIKSTRSPMAYITPSRPEVGLKPAPVMASFSSQGPSPSYPQILKPDITAPGEYVVAAYTEAPGVDGAMPFSILSGTSMSCPHVAGVVGLLKALHPAWSPAAIKSAIMTTARIQDNQGREISNESFVAASPFGFGSGHVQPNRAANPGLVYDSTAADYLDFLCAIGYNSSRIALFEPHACPSNPARPEDLNYPSITVPDLSQPITVTRRVRNVGGPGIYVARVRSPRGVSVAVRPARLKFGEAGEEKAFQVTLAPIDGAAITDYVFGSLIWSDGEHYVRSPITARVCPI